MLALATAAEAEMHKGYETPDYTVERTDGAVELRRYGSHIAAQVVIAGSRSAAIGAGFRVLAGYIFGKNASKAKVAMTVPVAQAPSETISMTTPVTQTGKDGEWVVQFMMPGAYTLETLPKPLDPSISFVTVPGSRQAVLRFSGLPQTAALAQKAEELQVWAAAQGVALGAGPFYYFYDSPMTLPWNRRNEVAFLLP